VATIEKPAIYEAPGRPGSPVAVNDRYDDLGGGAWVPPSGGEYFAGVIRGEEGTIFGWAAASRRARQL
jgi:hypothetical protein